MSARKLFIFSLIAFSVHIWASLRQTSPLSEMPLSVVSSLELSQRSDTLKRDSTGRRKPRYSVRRTGTPDRKVLNRHAADLRNPENLKTEVTYDEQDNTYSVGTTLELRQSSSAQGKGGLRRPPLRPSSSQQGKGESGSTLPTNAQGYNLGTATSYLSAPLLMTPKEYQEWSFQESMRSYYRKKNAEAFESEGKNKFDFTDMRFDLGPAEKIFGPGGVQIKTQGSAELKLGGNMKRVNNPALAANRRKTFGFDFDEKINLTLTGKVGDKVNMNLNYNTESTFDYDAQNLKLKYDGKEDDIVKLIEAGNVSFPSNMSLVPGVSSLFGLRTDVQFGRLKMQAVVSQKKSASKSVSSKGGSQTNSFEFSATDYEENRHFFLNHFFRQQYDRNMQSLPTIASGISIKRVEIWVTNKTASTTNNRNIIALADLGETTHLSDDQWTPNPEYRVPANRANSLYGQMVTTYAGARDISKATTVLDAIPGFEGSVDYEKLQSARLLSSSEYTVNQALGYVSLNTTLQTDDVLAIAYEYTYGGATYQVGEFAADVNNNADALFVKLLKGTTGSPHTSTWRLMMKNVYNLGASSMSSEKFRLDIKYQSDSTGVYLTYLPEDKLKGTPLLRVMQLDRLDANNKPNSNGRFDYIEGYTVSRGRIIFPVEEPFGEHLSRWIGDKRLARKYCFPQLYDSTKTVARQIAEHDKFVLSGQYSGTNNSEIDLGVMNIAPGSVVVTAGGVTLTENSDYLVDYGMGRVTIINQSILDAGTKVSASVESNDNYGMQRKTMMGLNLDYEVHKDLILGGTFMFLNEQPLTTKVNMGNEPLKNTLWGARINWKHESQWLTDMVDRLPLIQATQPSQISVNAEVAQLIAGQNKKIQGEASYLDDFESSSQKTSLAQPTYWSLSATPSMFGESRLSSDLRYGFRRALMAWYSVDPLFTRRSSTLTPSHIKGDLEQLSNHFVREVFERELYPQKAQNSYTSASSLRVMNLAFYPQERGPYNLTTEVDTEGRLQHPQENWGGMMRRMDNTDFEAQNIQYIEFWMMDPFIYDSNHTNPGGDFYINLGEVSEDILKDGKKYFESGMPVDGNSQYYSETLWGRVPNTNSVTYAFNNEKGSRARQDVGLNGLNDEEERTFPTYAQFLEQMRGRISQAQYDSLSADPANDDYHYYRGSDFDQAKISILNRYKRINMPQGNSADSDTNPESYETAWKSTPDIEDLNQDYTLNEYEKYYQYRISIRPQDMVVGQNHIVDKRVASVLLRNGKTEDCTWYLFRVPIQSYESKVGSISDFTSIRFMRMFMTGFRQDIILRLATLDLVHGDWRTYTQPLYTGHAPASDGTITVSTVNIEENNDKEPVNYILPPGISTITDPSQSQLVESNEQSMALTVQNLAPGDARAVYKNCRYNMRQYKHLQMFVHANALAQNVTATADGETSVFIRLGSDYKSNYYEYEVPLKLTAPGTDYNRYSPADQRAVWPEDNLIDIDLDLFTAIKKQRNARAGVGLASWNARYSEYDERRPSNRVTVMGNPTLGEVKTIMVGVRNNGRTIKSVEVWANELRLQEFSNEGGWAAKGNMNLQLSDIGSLNMAAQMETAGFGGIEQSVAERSDENTVDFQLTTQVDLGRVLPKKAKVTVPMYYSYGKTTVKPKYNPFDTDMRLDDALDALASQHERDSLKSLTTHTERTRNLSFSGMRVNIASRKHPMPYDPANFTFNYSRSVQDTEGQTTVYEHETNWKAGLNYAWSPNWKPWEPFKKLKGKSKWLQIIKDQNLAFAPQSLTFDTEITRNYYELQERDLDNLQAPNTIPANFSQTFLWNRNFQLRWDIFKALHFNFQSSTRAEVEEPHVQVNKDLYPDRYEAWKDSVRMSLRHFGRPLDYSQSVQLSYKLPIHRIPIFDWVNADASYNAAYNWKRGAQQTDGSTLGHTVNTQRTLNINGKFNLETLYNHSPFLKEVNKRFSASQAKNEANRKVQEKKRRDEERKKQQEERRKLVAEAKAESLKTGVPVDTILARKQPNTRGISTAKRPIKKVKGFTQELTIYPDSVIKLTHDQKSNRLRITAMDSTGHPVKLRFKRLDETTLRVKNNLQDTTQVRINVVALPKRQEQKWYTWAQAGARLLMSLRSVNFSYRNTYNLALPGFLPEVGDMLGQTRFRGSRPFAPGVGFGFGLVDDSYITKAKNNGWLLCADSVSTPATSARTEDLQIKAVVEPITDLKIDLHMSHTRNSNKSIQYMYQGNPTVESGSFQMTTISIRTAFRSMGNAKNGYRNRTFDDFKRGLDVMQRRVEGRYIGTPYPEGTGFEGTFNPENGTVSKYSADVMIPAFLAAYTGRDVRKSPLDIFPAMARMLPNWNVTYKGLSNLPWIRDHFKSVQLTHGYKSIYSIGSYQSLSSWIETMGSGGAMGYALNTTTGNYVPSSMYDISTVSLNESFSPLLGLNLTFMNNMTLKMEYKSSRVASLSITSAQINETDSKDLVIGWGYKINDFRIGSLFGTKKASVKMRRRAPNSKKRNEQDNEQTTVSSTKSNFAHALNLRFDFSLRNQSAIRRDLQTNLCEATSGSKAFKTSAAVEYAVSRMLSLSLYYDRQRSQPLLSSSSYPTVTQDFGMSVKFSLTR